MNPLNEKNTLSTIIAYINSKFDDDKINVNNAYTELKKCIFDNIRKTRQRPTPQPIYGMKIFQSPSYGDKATGQLGTYFGLNNIYSDVFLTPAEKIKSLDLNESDLMLSPILTKPNFNKYSNIGFSGTLSLGQSITFLLDQFISTLTKIKILKYNVFRFEKHFGGCIYAQTDCAGSSYFRDIDAGSTKNWYVALGISPYAEFINIKESNNGLCNDGNNSIQLHGDNRLTQLIYLASEPVNQTEVKFPLDDFNGSNGVPTYSYRIQNNQFDLASYVKAHNLFSYDSSTIMSLADVKEAIDYIFNAWKSKLQLLSYDFYTCHYNCHGNSINTPPSYDIAEKTILFDDASTVMGSPPGYTYSENIHVGDKIYGFNDSERTVSCRVVKKSTECVQSATISNSSPTCTITINWPTLRENQPTQSAGRPFVCRCQITTQELLISGENKVIGDLVQKTTGTGTSMNLAPTVDFTVKNTHIVGISTKSVRLFFHFSFEWRVQTDQKITFRSLGTTFSTKPTIYSPSLTESITLQSEKIPISKNVGQAFLMWVNAGGDSNIDESKSDDQGTFVINPGINVPITLDARFSSTNAIIYDYSRLNNAKDDPRGPFPNFAANTKNPTSYVNPDSGKETAMTCYYPTGIKKVGSDTWDSKAWRLSCQLYDIGSETHRIEQLSATHQLTATSETASFGYKVHHGSGDLCAIYDLYGDVKWINYDYAKLDALDTKLRDLDLDYNSKLTYNNSTIQSKIPTYYQAYPKGVAAQASLTSYYPVCDKSESWNKKGWRLALSAIEFDKSLSTELSSISLIDQMLNQPFAKIYSDDVKMTGTQYTALSVHHLTRNTCYELNVANEFSQVIGTNLTSTTIICLSTNEFGEKQIVEQKNAQQYKYEVKDGSERVGWLNVDATDTELMDEFQSSLTFDLSESTLDLPSELKTMYQLVALDGETWKACEQFQSSESISSVIATFNRPECKLQVYIDNGNKSKYSKVQYMLETYDVDLATKTSNPDKDQTVVYNTSQPLELNFSDETLIEKIPAYNISTTALSTSTQTAVNSPASYAYKDRATKDGTKMISQGGSDISVVFDIAGKIRDIHYDYSALNYVKNKAYCIDKYDGEIVHNTSNPTFYQAVGTAKTTLTSYYPTGSFVNKWILSSEMYNITDPAHPDLLASNKQSKVKTPLTATYSDLKTGTTINNGVEISVKYGLLGKFRTIDYNYDNIISVQNKISNDFEGKTDFQYTESTSNPGNYYQGLATPTAMSFYYPNGDATEKRRFKISILSSTDDKTEQQQLTSFQQTAFKNNENVSYTPPKNIDGVNLSIVYDIAGTYRTIKYDYTQLDTAIQFIKDRFGLDLTYYQNTLNDKYYQSNTALTGNVVLTSYYPSTGTLPAYLIMAAKAYNYQNGNPDDLTFLKGNSQTAIRTPESFTFNDETDAQKKTYDGAEISVAFGIEGFLKEVDYDFSDMEEKSLIDLATRPPTEPYSTTDTSPYSLLSSDYPYYYQALSTAVKIHMTYPTIQNGTAVPLSCEIYEQLSDETGYVLKKTEKQTKNKTTGACTPAVFDYSIAASAKTDITRPKVKFKFVAPTV